MPDSRRPFPDELWNVRLGTSYRHLFDPGWIAGGGVSLGSASDQPFAAFDDIVAGANAFLRLPQGEHNAWLFSLAYSSNSELPFPVPGVAYICHPSDCLRVQLGLPFQLLYRPVDEWTLELSYMLVRTVHARATYQPWRPLGVCVGFDWRMRAISWPAAKTRLTASSITTSACPPASKFTSAAGPHLTWAAATHSTASTSRDGPTPTATTTAWTWATARSQRSGWVSGTDPDYDQEPTRLA